MLTWGRGYACVSPGPEERPLWVPSRCVKPQHEQRTEDLPDSQPREVPEDLLDLIAAIMGLISIATCSCHVWSSSTPDGTDHRICTKMA